MSLKTAMTLPRLSLCTAMVLAALSTLNAQSVATAPVGAMSYSIPANSTQSLGFPMLRPAVFTGSVSAGDATSVTLEGAGLNIGATLTGGVPYYLEVVGHVNGSTSDNVGERFEIDEASTATNANSVIVVDTGSNLNTASGSLSTLVGYKVALRPHWTLAALFGTGTGATNLNSATTATSADQVLAWTGTAWSTYWFRQNSAGTSKEWRNTATTTTNQDSAIVPPGVGIYFKRKAGDLSLTSVGEVRTNPFVRNLDNTVQLVAMGFPTDRSPVQLSFLPPAGFTAATASNAADQILTWTGSSFSTYWLRRNSAGDIIQWRNTTTGTTDQSNNSFINAAQAVFIKPQATIDDLVQPTPFSL